MIKNRANFDKIDDYYNYPQAKKEKNSGLKTLLTLGLVGLGGYGGYKLLKKYGSRFGKNVSDNKQPNSLPFKNITDETVVENPSPSNPPKKPESITELESSSKETFKPTKPQPRKLTKYEIIRKRQSKEPYITLAPTKYSKLDRDIEDYNPWQYSLDIDHKKVVMGGDIGVGMTISDNAPSSLKNFFTSRNNLITSAKNNTKLSKDDKRLIRAEDVDNLENSINFQKLTSKSKTREKFDKYKLDRDEYSKLLDDRIEKGKNLRKTNPYDNSAFNELLITNNLAEFKKLTNKNVRANFSNRNNIL